MWREERKSDVTLNGTQEVIGGTRSLRLRYSPQLCGEGNGKGDLNILKAKG